jgi:Ca2+-binding EF-hand superfamily protein
VQKFFYESDANHDGKITVSELSLALEKAGVLHAATGEDEPGASASASASASAFSSAADAAGADRLSGGRTVAQEVERILKQADIDGDGTLSYNELVLSTVQRKLSAKEER